MSAAAQTRIFGMRLGVDPKLIVVGLVVVAGLLYWFNSRGEEAPATVTNSQTAASASAAGAAASPQSLRRAPARRQARRDTNRGTLRLEAVDATRGDIDPTLRLDLLARLQTVELAPNGRNLFEAGPAPVNPAAPPIKGPTIVPKPRPGQPGAPGAATPPAEQPLNIPLKFYGFVRPVGKGVPNQGFFLDGDNVLVASEGEVLKGHYLVVELTPNSARLEDTQLKKSATLQVVPEAREEM